MHQVELKPFNVPNFVVQKMPVGSRQDGFKEAPTYPLSDISAETLSAMCDEFRAEVFVKAGKPDPEKPVIREQACAKVN